MKKCLYIVSLLMLSLSGCQKTEVENYEKEAVRSDFRGELEELLDTRTTLDKNNNVRWSEGDQIIIFNGSTLGGKYQVTDDSVGETSAGFDYIENATGGFVSGSDIEHNVALYPFDSKVKCAKGDDKEPTESYILTKVKALSEQNYVKDSFGPGTFPMVAVTSSVSDYRLNFKNVFGGMKLQLKGDCTVASITVKGQASEPIAGTVSVTAFVDGSAPTVLMGADATASVTLDCGEYGVELNEETATNFIIALPPTTFKSGFTVSIVDTEGRLMIIKTSKENKIYRSSLLKMPEITVDASKTASIELPETETVIASAASTFDVAVNANVEYEVVMPAVDWLHLENASGSSCQTFSVDENTEYDSRSAEIVFKSKVHDQQRTFTVTQLQKDAIILAKDTYDIDIKGGTLAIDLQTNVDFEVSIASDAQSWISHVSTRALENKVLTLSIASCSEDVDRTGAVVLTKDGLSQTINIHQYSMISKEPIVFADANVKKACVAAFDTDGDGEVSYKEAAAARSLSGVFDLYSSIKSFDELEYFTSVTSLPDRLFEGCQNLRSVKLHSNISSCGQYCFAGCISLAEIKLPQNLNSIGTGSFSGCSSLTSITIPASVCELSDHCFSGCSSLSSIVISEGLQSIGNYSLSGCVQLADLDLPDSITSIGNYSFNSCTSLESIDLPTSVLELGEGCFANCISLNKLTLPATIVNIPAYFIKECLKLNDLVIPSSVKSIRANAFSGAYIEHLTIPESVTSLNGAFLDRNKVIKQVTCNASIRNIPTFYDSSRRINVGCFAECTNLETVIINSQITSLPSYCFKECLYLKSVVLPNTVTSIGSGCFVNCFDLEAFNIPDSVQEIGGGCFFNCKSLKNIVIPNGVTNLPYISELYYYGYDENRNRENSYLGSGGCFTNCKSLESIKISSTVTEMGKSSFRGCSSLQSIYIPSSVPILGDDFFYGCTALQSINIPSSVSVLGEDCFARCSSLRSINIPSSIHTIGAGCFIGCESLETVSIPSTVRQLSDNLFSSCLSLKNINIPLSVVEIGKGCFAFCKSLEEIDIPESVLQMGSACFTNCTSLTNIKLPSQIKELPYGSCSWIDGDHYYTGGGYGFFSGCSSLTSIEIPDNVTELGEEAFSGCSKLESVMLGSGLTSIGYRTFYNCSSLSSIVIPDNVTLLDASTFNGCLGLTSVIMGSGLASIADKTFSGLSNLTSVTLGSGLTSIGSNAFYNCSSLSSIVIPDNVTELGDYAFAYCSNLASATLGSGLTSIGYRAFYGCSSLSSIVIPDNVTSIGSGTFSGCSNLASATLGSGLTTIGGSAFYGCSCLSSIVIPDNVTELGSQAFAYCSNLASATLGSGLTSIGSNAFYYCSSLSSIVIPDNVTELGNQAFYNCTELASVICRPVVPPTLGSSVFSYNKSGRIISVPEASVDAYKSSWSSYASSIQAMTE